MRTIKVEDHLEETDIKQTQLAQKGGVRCSSAHAAYTPTGLLHRHAHHEILIIHRGGGTHQVDDHVYTVEDNQVYFLRPGQIHQFQPAPNTEFYFVAIDNAEVALQGPYSLSDFEFFQSFQSTGQLVLQSIEPIIDLVKILQTETHQSYERTNQSLLVGGYLTVLLVRLQREFLRSKENATPDRRPELISKFNQLIDSPNSHSRFVKEYASKLHVSANYLNEMVKDYTGEPASHWINLSIITEAKRRLKLTHKSIAEIALELGFQEATHFSRFFKKHVQTTPNQFRQL